MLPQGIFPSSYPRTDPMPRNISKNQAKSSFTPSSSRQVMLSVREGSISDFCASKSSGLLALHFSSSPSCQVFVRSKPLVGVVQLVTQELPNTPQCHRCGAIPVSTQLILGRGAIGKIGRTVAAFEWSAESIVIVVCRSRIVHSSCSTWSLVAALGNQVLGGVSVWILV